MALVDLYPKDNGDPTYYNETIFTVFDDFIPQLLVDPGTQLLSVAAGDAVEWEYDFYGFLAKCGIEAKYRYLTLRVNGMTSPFEWHRDTSMNPFAWMLTMYLPNRKMIDQIVQAQNATAITGLT